MFCKQALTWQVRHLFLYVASNLLQAQWDSHLWKKTEEKKTNIT